MTASKYARKAQSFEIKNPQGPATDGQLRQIGRLIRFKKTDVEYGNYIVEALELPMTRGEADREIKRLAKCPNIQATVARQNNVVTGAVKAAEAKVGPKRCSDTDIAKLLGKVAAKRAADKGLVLFVS